MSDHLEDIKTFVAVVQAPGFAGAGERLGLAKSAISRRIRDLENRLGSRLLQRTTRRISLTETGTEFYQRSLKILADLREAEDIASKGASEPVGRLRISGPVSFGILHLAPAIGEFMTRYGRVSVDLDLQDQAIDLIKDGFDLAIRVTRLADKDSSLIARRIAPIRHVVCASPKYFQKHGRPTTPQDLRDHAVLTYSHNNFRFWRFTGGDYSVDARTILTCNNGDALREAAIAGCGLACLPTFIVHDAVVSGKLEICLRKHEIAPRALYAVYPSTKYLSAKVRVFIDFLVEKFGKEPHWDRGVFRD